MTNSLAEEFRVIEIKMLKDNSDNNIKLLEGLNELMHDIVSARYRVKINFVQPDGERYPSVMFNDKIGYGVQSVLTIIRNIITTNPSTQKAREEASSNGVVDNADDYKSLMLDELKRQKDDDDDDNEKSQVKDKMQEFDKRKEKFKQQRTHHGATTSSSENKSSSSVVSSAPANVRPMATATPSMSYKSHDNDITDALNDISRKGDNDEMSRRDNDLMKKFYENLQSSDE